LLVVRVQATRGDARVLVFGGAGAAAKLRQAAQADGWRSGSGGAVRVEGTVGAHRLHNGLVVAPRRLTFFPDQLRQDLRVVRHKGPVFCRKHFSFRGFFGKNLHRLG
jgi:hypothetical protein